MNKKYLYFILAMAIGFSSCSKEEKVVIEEEGNLPKPTAVFTYEVVDPKDPFTIKFNNTSTNFSISRWSFDNDSTSSEISPTHTFLYTGIFNVKLVTLNDEEFWAQREEVMKILPEEIVELVATPIGGDLQMSYDTEMTVDKTEWFVKNGDGDYVSMSTEPEMTLNIPTGEFRDAYVWVTTPKGSKLRRDMLLADLGVVQDLTTLDNEFTIAKENGSGKDASEGSTKLIDNNITTKVYVGDVNDSYFWWQFEYFEPQIINGYSMTSGNDSPSRDPKTWEFLGSNDGENWVVLDRREEEEFLTGGPNNDGRRATRIFSFDNDESYSFYRMHIIERISSGSFQLSEFRMLQLPR